MLAVVACDSFFSTHLNHVYATVSLVFAIRALCFHLHAILGTVYMFTHGRLPDSDKKYRFPVTHVRVEFAHCALTN